MFDFDQPIERRGTDSYKWDDNERLFGRGDLLPFWVADMDFATPEPILEAIRKRTEHPVLGYHIRSEDYFGAIRSWFRERHDWDIPREWLMFCPPSTIVAIHGLVMKLTAPGDSLAAPTPNYGPLVNIVRTSDRRLINCPMSETNGRFALDIDDLARRLETDTRIVILCSPNNPTGRVFTRDELEALAALAEERDLIVISDEVHCDLVLPGHRHLPYSTIGGERSITVLSPNKTFNTAGIPQATLVIPDPEIRKLFGEFLDTAQLNHDSSFGAAGMIAGYRHCGPWLDSLVDYLAGNHEFVAAYLEENVPGVKKVVAEATYLAWLDCRGTGLTEAELMDRLVNRGGVGLYGASEFGREGEGFLRMNLACPRSRLEDGLERIRSALS